MWAGPQTELKQMCQTDAGDLPSGAAGDLVSCKAALGCTFLGFLNSANGSSHPFCFGWEGKAPMDDKSLTYFRPASPPLALLQKNYVHTPFCRRLVSFCFWICLASSIFKRHLVCYECIADGSHAQTGQHSSSSTNSSTTSPFLPNLQTEFS